jgi:bifunctional UDP-N-acetylglucosamine pyrophosphorylase/glucosamine-1-phosphate N-acetyltransferase
MNHTLPKVLIDLNGQPIIAHLLKSVKEAQIDPRPVIVIGRQAEIVREVLGEEYDYVLQEELLGTGHAVSQTEKLLKDKTENVMVLYGDHPYLTTSSIKKLAEIHLIKNHIISLMTFKIPNFENWYSFFYDFGRIIRGNDGQIKEIVEKKDASAEQLKITELNPAHFCFKADWLWDNLKKIQNNNTQSEYYLTDLAKMAIDQGLRLDSIDIDPKEALGINTPEQFEVVLQVHK